MLNSHSRTPRTTPVLPSHLSTRRYFGSQSVVSYLSVPALDHSIRPECKSFLPSFVSRFRTKSAGFRTILDENNDGKSEDLFAKALSQKLTTPWIEQVFQKRECAKFIQVYQNDPNKCGCGRSRQAHSTSVLNARHEFDEGKEERWTIGRNTAVEHTDAFGTIEFLGGPHPHKAQYVRLGFDSDPADIMYLFEKVWQMQPPKLVITVHGGIANFDMQPKLARIFHKGLLKAAKTTGINTGVVRHVAAALEGSSAYPRSRSKLVTIGIAPWGLLKKRDDLVGKDVTVPYHPHGFSPKGRFTVLNHRHSYFLLVDNGTVGRYGADIILRKRLEEYISQKQTIEGGSRRVPVVCVVLEGGTCTVRAVLNYVTNIPPVPVVVCDGSGRAADLLAFAHQYIQDDGTLPDEIRQQLLGLVQSVFGYNKPNAEKVILELMMCVRKRHLITVFRLGEDQQQDVDHAILTALLKGQDLKTPDQLALSLSWNRVDIARSDIFVLGQEWPAHALHNAMMEALIYDRVDFVRLLLENGVSMRKFLTVQRLEELYNTNKGPPNTLYYIVRDVVRISHDYRYTLPDIGLALEKLMGSAYQSTYTSREFRSKHFAYKQYEQHQYQDDQNRMSVDPDVTKWTLESPNQALRKHILWRSMSKHDKHRVAPVRTPTGASLVNSGRNSIIDGEKTEDELSSTLHEVEPVFNYPFNELLIWAVLTKRQDMARCMWEHGEEATAKALVACRLYKCLAKEAAEDYLEVEVCEELRKYAEEFRKLSLELLENCYQQDDDQTLQLLTYELRNWANHTCLSLAVIANNKEFLAHPCCQILLADLWHGGMRMRSQPNLKVIMGLLVPPTILLLEFKSREELMQQPQTAAEHAEDVDAATESWSDESNGVDRRSEVSGSDDELEDNAFDPELGLGSSSAHDSTPSVNLTSVKWEEECGGYMHCAQLVSCT